MDKFLAQFSKTTLAVTAIGAGILFIIFNDPPLSLCKTQMDTIQQSQRLFLFKDPKSKVAKTTKFQNLRDRCKESNNPGGCYELFQNMKVLLGELDNLPRECGGAAGGVAEVREALWDSMNILVRVAWGEKPPASYHAKFGWLDTADLSLFCKLKARLQETYGENSWNNYRDKTMQDLPGANALPRNQVWELSLFSENCARYP